MSRVSVGSVRSNRSSRASTARLSKANVDLKPQLTDGERRQAQAAWTVIKNPQDESDQVKSRNSLLDVAHILGYNPSKKEIREFMPKRTTFKFKDLLTFLRTCEKLDHNEILSGFRIMDENGDGELSKEELIHHLTNYGERMSTEEVEVVLGLFDVDGDGTIDYNEFCSMITSFGNAARIHFEPKEQQPSDPSHRGTASTTTNNVPAVMSQHQPPPDLKNWDGDRLHGMFQVSGGGRVASQQYGFHLSEPSEVFLSLRSFHSMGFYSSAGDAPLVDTRFYLVRLGETGDSLPEIIGATLLQSDKEICLRMDLDAGSYKIMPFSTGCYLRQQARTGLVADLTYSKNGDLFWNDQALTMLKHIFDRFDFDETGTIGQSEYSMLQTITDGKTCDETTWAMIKDEVETVEGELTFKGFCDFFMLIGGEDTQNGPSELLKFFEHFEKLGFSRSLQPDELAKFTLFVFTKKHSISELYVLPINEVEVQQVDLLDILQCGEGALVKDGLYMYTRRGMNHTSIGFKNLGGRVAEYTIDFSASRNVISNLDSLKVQIKIPPGGATICCHLLPLRRNEEWYVDCKIH